MITFPLARISTAAFAVAFGCSITAQTTVNITPAADNTLYEDPTGQLSNGVGDNVFVSVTAQPSNSIRRALFFFAVDQVIPAGATIIEARLDLEVAQSPAFPPITTFVHRVQQQWGEGLSNAPGNEGGGTQAEPGDATWLHAVYPAIFWANPGGDFNPTPSFSFGLASLGPASTGTPAGLVADVQDWLDNPTQNFGWLLKTDETLPTTARRIRSAQAPSNNPTLVVTYLEPGETGTVGIGCPSGSGTYDLSISGAATGGTTVQLVHDNAPAPSIGINFFSLGLDPQGFPLFTDCSLYLPLSQPLIGGDAFITSGATVNSPFLVPSGFPGFLIASQGAVLDATPISVSLSNAAVMILQ